MVSAGCSEAPSAEAPPTFANVQALLSRACAFSSCHGSATNPGAGLRLTPAESYAALVRRPSTQVPRLALVQPGDPGASWLLFKVDGTLASVSECQGASRTCGVAMPERADPLSAEDRSLLRRWIAAGAPGP